MPTTALTKPCAQCGKPIVGMPSQLAKRRFCTKECVGASRRAKRKVEWVDLTCQTCEQRFQVTPAWARNGRRKFCSKTCHNRAPGHRKRVGQGHTEAARQRMKEAATGKFLRENSTQWKGGRYRDRSGYVHVMIATLPTPARELAEAMRPTKNYILEHRVVAAILLERPLGREEIVHHKNGAKADNRPENLEVMRRDAHSGQHREMEREAARLRREVDALKWLTVMFLMAGQGSSRS